MRQIDMNVAEALQSQGLSRRRKVTLNYKLNAHLIRRKDEESLNMKMNV